MLLHNLQEYLRVCNVNWICQWLIGGFYKVNNLFYLSFYELGLGMDSQVDGVHATDLGMQQYADAYYKKIENILYPAFKVMCISVMLST